MDAIPLYTQLFTERCVLSVVADEDLDHIWTATRYPGFNDGMLWDPPATREEISGWTERTLDLWRKDAQYTFSIRSKDNAGFIGRIVLRPLKPEEGIWYLGYWIHPLHWNKGYATEAARAMLNFGFTQLGCRRIESSHALWNRASAAVIKKLGMRFLRENPKGFMKRGEWIAEGEYYLDAKDFRPGNL
jgi:[ribosomal protein S5]-alanine N-acetyltransferase